MLLPVDDRCVDFDVVLIEGNDGDAHLFLFLLLPPSPAETETDTATTVSTVRKHVEWARMDNDFFVFDC